MDGRSTATGGKGKPLQRVEIYGEPIYCATNTCSLLATVIFRCFAPVERGWEYRTLPLCARHHQTYRAQMRKREPIAPATRGRALP